MPKKLCFAKVIPKILKKQNKIRQNMKRKPKNYKIQI
jgi:hypothetical protein